MFTFDWYLIVMFIMLLSLTYLVKDKEDCDWKSGSVYFLWGCYIIYVLCFKNSIA